MRYDVLGILLSTKLVRVIDRGLDLDDAERRVDELINSNAFETEFFVERLSGKYETGSEWEG